MEALVRRPTRAGIAARFGFLGAVLLAAAPAGAFEGAITGAHGIAMRGEPKYGPDFQHLDYADPAAPKAGEIKLAVPNSYDSLNLFILRGQPAAGLNLVYQTLTESPADEPITEYGVIAETIDVPADRSSVSFTLRPQERWNDGKPITPEDVIWSFETLKEKGQPFYRSYYADVVKAERTGERRVTFTFKGPGNTELPLIMGQLPVLPKHYWQGRDFAASTLDPPLGSGPYKIAEVQPGRSITYKRVEDWWARDLPFFRGQYNFDTVRFDYYRDMNVMVEAFKAGAFDLRIENSAKNWATAYDVPAVRDGRIVREEIHTEDPHGMQAFFFNTRRPLFQDKRVRIALNYLFDFEWLNKNIFFDQYKRTTSFFANSELASQGLPSPAELKLLEPLRGRIPEEVFTKEFKLPATDGSGNIRSNLRVALDLLKEAGWELKNQQLVKAATGERMSFEILLVQADFDRIVQPYLRNLERAGIHATVRIVDSAQYQNRVNDFDFDMIVSTAPQSLSPGNEQRDFWGSAAADERGSRNVAGIKDPAVDTLIDAVIAAPDRDGEIAAARALDRELLWSWIVIPQWYDDRIKVAYWNRFAHPATMSRYGLPYLQTWWVDRDKEAKLAGGQQRSEVR